MDESGITAVHKPHRILARKGQKQVGEITSGERGKTATVVCAFNAIGTYVSPMIIFPRKRLPMIMMAGAIGACSDSSWIDSTIFVNWLRHFVEFTKASN